GSAGALAVFRSPEQAPLPRPVFLPPAARRPQPPPAPAPAADSADRSSALRPAHPAPPATFDSLGKQNESWAYSPFASRLLARRASEGASKPSLARPANRAHGVVKMLFPFASNKLKLALSLPSPSMTRRVLVWS